MKAQRVFLENIEDFKQAEALSLPRPQKIEPKFVATDFYFKLNMVSNCFITIDNFISVRYLDGSEALLKNDRKVFIKLVQYLENQ